MRRESSLQGWRRGRKEECPRQTEQNLQRCRDSKKSPAHQVSEDKQRVLCGLGGLGEGGMRLKARVGVVLRAEGDAEPFRLDIDNIRLALGRPLRLQFREQIVRGQNERGGTSGAVRVIGQEMVAAQSGRTDSRSGGRGERRAVDTHN